MLLFHKFMIIMEYNIYSYISSMILLWQHLLLIESSVNLALEKNTTQSSDYAGYISSNAVDGLNKVCSTHGGFTHTQDGTNEWWQVDLGGMFEIKRIEIYHRTNHLNRLSGYNLNITTSLNPLETWRCYKDKDIGLPYNSTQSHICPSLGRYVTFSRERVTPDSEGDKAVINLCEFEVYGCPQGHYGNENCNSSCSVGCLNSSCDPDNGHCNCSIDWTGDKCDKFHCNIGRYLLGDICITCSDECLNNRCNNVTSECLDGCNPSFYGKFCNLTCPTNCSISCARYSGQCVGCKVGFYGDKCDKICEWNCKDNVCKQDDGYCSRCQHPYKGSKCTECVDGYFGDTCTPCPRRCGNELCRKNDGYCTEGCKNGFFGNFCTLSCPVNCKQNKCDRQTGDCSDGCRTGSFIGNRCNVCVYWLYGRDCDIACPVNCKHSMCVGKDGICILGCKYANMTGNHCDGYRTTTEGLAFKINLYIPSIIAGAVSLINIIFIAVILVLFCKRRQRKEAVYENQNPLDWTQEGMNQQDNTQLEQQQTIHYETLGLHDRGNVNSNLEAYTGLNVNTEGRY